MGQALRVLRGGYWNNNDNNCRSANRNNNNPDNRNNNNGFRILRTPARRNRMMGIMRAHTGESRPVPATAATLSKDKPARRALVGSPKTSAAHPYSPSGNTLPFDTIRNQQIYFVWILAACLACGERAKEKVMHIVWTEYLRYRAALRGFDLAVVEHIVRYSSERYLDHVTGSRIAVGPHGSILVMIPYDAGTI